MGFDQYFGVINSHNQAPFVWVDNNRVVGRRPGEKIFVEGNRKDIQGFTNRRVNGQIGPKLVERVVDFLRRNQTRPLFLYLPACAVHTPITPAPFVQGTSQAGGYGDFVQEFD